MADKQKTTQEEPRVPFEGLPFATMMKQMMGGQQGGGCNCAAMMAQTLAPPARAGVMAMCGGAQAPGEKKESAAEAAQEAKEARNG